ncbi:MAG: hypothetical protein WD176_04875, partial [Pirellulales bacterium]
RLSIVIAGKSDAHSLETTLVSVLENRPADFEVIVALAHPYEDLYHLAGEVQFLAAGPHASWEACANAGVARSAANVVHLLTSGAQVTEGWAEWALAHFADGHVAAVAPLVRCPRSPADASLGVQYHRGGRRRIVPPSPNACTPADVLGPCDAAGFYRRQALELAGGFCPAIPGTSDVDVALNLARLGYHAVAEPRSIVLAPATPPPHCSAFYQGLASERVFWRHADWQGWSSSLAAHALVTLAEGLTAVVRPSHFARLAGRLVGLIESPRWRSFHRSRQLQAEEAACARLQAGAQAASRGPNQSVKARRAA